MFPETKPIISKLSPEFKSIEVYPVHDLHYGNEMYDAHKWNALRDEIRSQENRFVVWVGDLCEAALPNSKSNSLLQKHSPADQREFLVEQFRAFKDRTLGIVDGNHEARFTRNAGLFPLYDAACIAGIEEKYRSTYAIMDIMVGSGYERHADKQFQYVGFVIHRSKDLKSFSSSDALEGFDFCVYGHDHDPKDHARGKLVYIRNKHQIKFHSCENVDCGAFLNYGGYGAMAGYRPLSPKLYKLVLDGTKRDIKTVGFYVD